MSACEHSLRHATVAGIATIGSNAKGGRKCGHILRRHARGPAPPSPIAAKVARGVQPWCKSLPSGARSHSYDHGKYEGAAFSISSLSLSLSLPRLGVEQPRARKAAVPCISWLDSSAQGWVSKHASI